MHNGEKRGGERGEERPPQPRERPPNNNNNAKAAKEGGRDDRETHAYKANIDKHRASLFFWPQKNCVLKVCAESSF